MIELKEIFNQPREDEKTGTDGLLYCVRCGTPRQKQLEVLGRQYRPRCLCVCQAEAARKAEETRRAMELRDRIGRYRSVGMADEALKQATFENDRCGGGEAEIAMRYVNQWEQMRQQALGLVLWGPVGTGKTYLAACIANALLDRAVPVLMTSFGRILGGMPGAATGEQSRYIDSFNSFDLLVIDDLGAERNTEFALEQVYNIIDARYRARLPMIVTTNLTLQEMKNPKSLARQRIYSRVLERCVPLNVNRRAIREENAGSAVRQTAALLKPES